MDCRRRRVAPALAGPLPGTARMAAALRTQDNCFAQVDRPLGSAVPVDGDEATDVASPRRAGGGGAIAADLPVTVH